MQYIKFTYINGNHMPDFDGLEFDFALTSQYPTDRPVFYGTCESASGDGLVEVISKDTYDADKAAELIARRSKLIAETVKPFEDKIAEIDAKCAGSLRATLLGTAIDYDEAVLIDAELTADALRTELKSILASL